VPNYLSLFCLEPTEAVISLAEIARLSGRGQARNSHPVAAERICALLGPFLETSRIRAAGNRQRSRANGAEQRCNQNHDPDFHRIDSLLDIKKGRSTATNLIPECECRSRNLQSAEMSSMEICSLFFCFCSKTNPLEKANKAVQERLKSHLPKALDSLIDVKASSDVVVRSYAVYK
jgi:hypothetical protein